MGLVLSQKTRGPIRGPRPLSAASIEGGQTSVPAACTSLSPTDRGDGNQLAGPKQDGAGKICPADNESPDARGPIARCG